VEEKFAEELKADRAKHEELRDAKGEMEARFEEQLAEMEAAHARELEELEVTYRAKITGEMERYDALVKDRDAMNEEFDAANAALVKEQAGSVDALKTRYEGAIRAEQDAITELEERKRAMQEDFAGVADDIEVSAWRRPRRPQAMQLPRHRPPPLLPRSHRSWTWMRRWRTIARGTRPSCSLNPRRPRCCDWRTGS